MCSQIRIKQTPLFERTIKKLNKQDKKALDGAVRHVAQNPEAGQVKSGDLSEVQVYKFRFTNHQGLLAYTYIEEELVLTLLGVGSHENFYRDLKHYIKS